ncbi:hypothetical protein ACFLZH_02375 [Patescibacteria group bacterium]
MARPEIPKRREIKKPLTKKQKEAIEAAKKAKEAKEIKEAKKLGRELCADYHTRLDKAGGYFSGKAMVIANELLPKFLNFLKKYKDVLPKMKSFKFVIEHRTEYLKLMSKLSKRDLIKAFMGKFKPTATQTGILTTDIAQLEKLAQKSPEFQKLTEDDFKSSILALSSTKKGLEKLLKRKNEYKKTDAIKILQPSSKVGKRDARVDDLVAAGNFLKGVKILKNNLSRLRRKRFVLKKKAVPEKPKAKPKSKKKKT